MLVQVSIQCMTPVRTHLCGGVLYNHRTVITSGSRNKFGRGQIFRQSTAGDQTLAKIYEFKLTLKGPGILGVEARPINYTYLDLIGSIPGKIYSSDVKNFLISPTQGITVTKLPL